MLQPPAPRHVVVQHARVPLPGVLRQLLRLFAVAVVVVVVAGAGVATFVVMHLEHGLTTKAVHLAGESAVPPDIGAIAGGVNLLLIGTDNCEASYAKLFGQRCAGTDAAIDASANNDVNILLHISDHPRRVTVISIPRDMIVPTPSCTTASGQVTPATDGAMFNTTYNAGGLACVVKAASQLTGMDIPFAAQINWGGVMNLTDAVGGVTVCIAHGIDDPYTNLHLPPGNVTIKGYEALQFLRTRHGVGDGSDLGRISNQEQYLSRLVQKMISGGTLSNPALLYKLAITAVQNITPSASLTNPLTLVQIALAVKSVPFNQFVFVQYPTETDPSNPNRVIPNVSAAQALMTALAQNKQLVLTGGTSQGYGVTLATPAPTPGSSATPTPGSSSTPTAAPSPSATPSQVAQLPPSIAGQTAAEQTCSNGNGVNG